jgi:hypothetical protein
MKLTWTLIAVAALGCGKKDSGSEPAKTADPAKAVEAAPPPAPFKGPLTAELVLSAKDVAKSMDPWDQGFAKLQAKLGPPTNVKDSKYRWAVMTGDDCTYFYVSKDDGKRMGVDGFIVGSVMTPMKVGKDELPGNRDECLEVLGKTSGPVEDPNAAGPPADGKVTVAMLMDNAAKAPSKWNGKEVTVTGVASTFMTNTVNGQKTGELPVFDAADKDHKNGADCKLDTIPAKPPVSGKPVTIKATVKVEQGMNGTGAKANFVRLEQCSIAK